MEVAFRVVRVLFAVSAAAPAAATYMYDASPNSGFIVTTGGVGGYVKKMPAHKKYFIGNNIQKNMKWVNERAVDSYFKILKSSPKSFPDRGHDRRYTQAAGDGGQTESPILQQKKTEKNNKNEVQHIPNKKEDNINERVNPTKNTNEIMSHKNEPFFRPTKNEYFKGNNMYERQHSLDSHYHKGRVPADEAEGKNKVSERRPYPTQMHASGVKDKILHKSNVNNDRSVQGKARILTDIPQKTIDRSLPKEGGYKKRHTIDKHKFRHEKLKSSHNKAKQSRVDEALQSTVGGERNVAGDHTKPSGRRDMPARIGNFDVGIEVKSRPYALFYRMNQEDFDQPELLSAEARTNVEDLDDMYYKTSVTSYNGGSAHRQPRKTVNYTAFRDR